MEFEKRELSGREKDEASIKLLRKLREQLYSSDASNRRRAAYKLSWMQEDGLDILKTALFGNCPVPTRNAAAYGLRKMRGRMKKIALEVLQKGLKHHDTSTKEICRNALQLLGQKVPKVAVPRKPPVSHLTIREIPRKSSPRRRVVNRRTRR
ncbi:MAG TPA: hypothetical protein VMW72_04825 [Sedimentisphaerales bacterium]|nr:hypothetical protein [Sedimentisphaerales bacterium]